MKIKTYSLILTTSLLIISSCADIPDNEYVIAMEEAEKKVSLSLSEGQDFIYRLESPAPTKSDSCRIIVKKDPDGVYGINYALEWDCSKRAQRWTAYQMYKGNTVSRVNRSGDDAWHEEEDIDPLYRSTYSDYSGSGYTRGHIIPSADRLQSANMNYQTFSYANMQPQLYSFNGGIWGDMEAKIRTWNRDNFRDTLYIVKGGTIDKPEHIFGYTQSGLLIPKYFFMAILKVNISPTNNEKIYSALAFWIEHKGGYDNAKLTDFVISIDKLEEYTGLDLFYNLPDDIEQNIEKSVDINKWDF